MNNLDMYSREKVARIRQEEILRDGRNARQFPIDLTAIAANRKVALAVGALIALTAIAIAALAGGLYLPV